MAQTPQEFKAARPQICGHEQGRQHIQTCEARLRSLNEALCHLDATLSLFDPDYDPKAIRAKRRYDRAKLFGKGKLTRFILDALRRSERPLTTLEVINGVAAEFNLEANIPAGVKARVRAGVALSVQRSRVYRQRGRARGLALVDCQLGLPFRRQVAQDCRQRFISVAPNNTPPMTRKDGMPTSISGAGTGRPIPHAEQGGVAWAAVAAFTHSQMATVNDLISAFPDAPRETTTRLRPSQVGLGIARLLSWAACRA
jgi:hypothetical protein